jgi:hypothetical protein
LDPEIFMNCAAIFFSFFFFFFFWGKTWVGEWLGRVMKYGYKEPLFFLKVLFFGSLFSQYELV